MRAFIVLGVLVAVCSARPDKDIMNNLLQMLKRAEGDDSSGDSQDIDFGKTLFLALKLTCESSAGERSDHANITCLILDVLHSYENVTKEHRKNMEKVGYCALVKHAHDTYPKPDDVEFDDRINTLINRCQEIYGKGEVLQSIHELTGVNAELLADTLEST